MPKRISKKTLAILVSAAVVVVGGGVVAAAFAMNHYPEPKATPAASTPTPTPEPDAVVPRVATARAAVDGWTLAGRTVVAAVLPEVGDTADGKVALRVDAPTAGEKLVVASAPVALAPSTEYTLTASVRLLEEKRLPTGVQLAVAGEAFDLPDLNAEWEDVEFTFTTAVDQPPVTLDVVLNGPVEGFGIDDVRLVDEEGTDAILNGSFEQAPSPQGIVNDSLIFSTDHAALAVSLSPGVVQWTATPTSGGEPVVGDTTVDAGLAPVPLDGLPQGHYSLSVTDAAGLSISTDIAVIDTPGLTLEQDSRFGVATHVERVGFDGSGMMAASLGFSEARNDVTWARNEKSPGEYVWAPEYQVGFGELHANGVGLLGLLTYGNTLYGSARTPNTPQAVEAYGAYAREVARTFDMVGLEVFNEFNHRTSDAPCGQSAACYMPLLESVHRQVKAEFPEMPIVSGSTAYYDRDWFIALWQNGGLALTDVISYHPYEAWRDRSPDSLSPIIQQSHADMQEYGGADRPVWITEFGYPSHNPGGVSVVEQAEWLVRTEVDSLSAGVEKFFWYDLVNDKEDAAAGEANFGLYEHNPRANVLARSPKPAAFAQASLISQIGGLAHSAEESDEAVQVHVFGTGDDAVRVAWAPGGEIERSFAADGSVTVVDMSGGTTVIAPVDGTVTIPLTASPVFIHSAQDDEDAR
ncbi:hypothetical protein [Microbacterium sp.]|uniref:hypothetical protein n=1 Tax=Microbacterium sp. TaxID=51671 RepID=UPI0039E2A31C